MSSSKVALILLVLVSLVVLAPACKKQVEIQPEPPAPAEVAPPAPPPVETPAKVEVTDSFPEERLVQREIEPTIEELNATGVLKTVYFEFDKSGLSDTARQTLRMNSDWLKSNARYNVVVEGHCDERGSIEYNLALGERRGSAVRDYLASLGVSRSRIRLISYGEERPVNPGHSESAWAQNRRAEFVVER